MARNNRRKGNTLEIANAVKTLYANIRFASVDHPVKSIVVTSSVPNEGKTTTTCELAKAIAGAGNTVLLIECDMRRRDLATRLDVRPAKGSYAVMSGDCALEQAVAKTATKGVFFLDTEPNIPNPADLLSSRAFARLIEEAQGVYDYVVLDTPPVGTFVDAAIAGRLVDGVVLVAKMGGPKRDELLNAYDQLVKADAHILGVCATFCEGTGSEYYYAYYDKGGNRLDMDALQEDGHPAEFSTLPEQRIARSRPMRHAAPSPASAGSQARAGQSASSQGAPASGVNPVRVDRRGR
ncbi:MAG: CpsD/CapB family tyrosine-protein kinase [Eggerthellaceae bacterium]